MGRQPMEGLLVVIEDGRLTGSGVDVVGPFTLEGTCDAEAGVVLVKEYLGAHQVGYWGEYDGASRLWGRWRVGFDGGRWEIRIRSDGSTAEEATVETLVGEVV